MPNNDLSIIKGTVIFVNLIEPKVFLNGDSKYSIRILIDKSDLKSCTKLQQQYQKTVATGAMIYRTEAFTNNENLTSPIKEGLQYYGAQYSNYYILDANSRIQPQVIDKYKKLLSHDCIKSGAQVYVALSFYPYSINGRCGISAKLHSLMFIAQGEPITEISDAIADFADFNFEE